MSSTKKRAPGAPKRHHLDRRADAIITAVGTDVGTGTDNSDQLLNSRQLAALLGVSEQWVEIARFRGEGPKYAKLSPRCIRYKRSDVMRWLQERAHASTAEYGRKTRKVA